MTLKSGLSTPERRRSANVGATKTALSRAEQRQLERLAALPETAIDTSDISEAPQENWANARRANLYRAVKQPVTMRIDSDVLAWFKEKTGGSGYQTEINRVLRQHVIAHEKKRA